MSFGGARLHPLAAGGTQPRLFTLSKSSLHDSRRWSTIAEKSCEGFPLTARKSACVPGVPTVAYRQSTLNVSSTSTWVAMSLFGLARQEYAVGARAGIKLDITGVTVHC